MADFGESGMDEIWESVSGTSSRTALARYPYHFTENDDVWTVRMKRKVSQVSSSLPSSGST